MSSTETCRYFIRKDSDGTVYSKARHKIDKTTRQIFMPAPPRSQWLEAANEVELWKLFKREHSATKHHCRRKQWVVHLSPDKGNDV